GRAGDRRGPSLPGRRARRPRRSAVLAHDVRAGLPVAEQVLGEVLEHALPEVLVRGAEAVARAGDDQHVEALVRFDERVDQAHRVRRVHVVVDLAVHEEQLALEVGGEFGVGRDPDLERTLRAAAALCAVLTAALLLALATAPPPAALAFTVAPFAVALPVLLSLLPALAFAVAATRIVAARRVAPLGQPVPALRPAGVVDVVVVVAGRGDRDLEEAVVRRLEHRRRAHEPAARVAVDPDARDVDERVAVGELLD